MKNIIYSDTSSSIRGKISIPADKSISHRSIIFAAMANGRSIVSNLLESQDVLDNKNSLEKLGIKFKKLDKNTNTYEITSYGFHKLKAKNNKEELYFGNSGTACRLFCGLLAGISGEFIITGDESLSIRPMQRVTNPLGQMGANIKQLTKQSLPLHITGKELKGIKYSLPVASAQIKTSLLVAGLFADGKTIIEEKIPTRDHSENMLKALGVNINVAKNQDASIITLDNQQKDILSYEYNIPADFSSAAFFIVMGVIAQDSHIQLKDINLNPLRTGLLQALRQMGAKIEVIKKENKTLGEDVGDIIVKNSVLKGISVDSKIVSSMIDEFPALAIAAIFADGETTFNDIKELRYKESDRINSLTSNFKKLGIQFEETEDSLKIYGNNTKEIEGGIAIDSFNDHRIAMAFLVLGVNCKKALKVIGCNSIETSFPNFYELCQELKVNISYSE